MSYGSAPGPASGQRFVARPAAQRAASLTLPPRAALYDGTARPVRSLTRGQADAFGPLAAFVADGEVTDLFVNGADGLYVDRGRGAEREESWLAPSERALRELAVRIVAAGGRHLDESAPCVDVRIADGIRVHAVLPPVSISGTLLSIRAPRVRQLTIAQLDRQAFFSPGAEELVREAVRARANVLVTGAGGSGNTTWHL
ncbi:ATPase, T2SS/T4P/T4SS family [Pseudoclavibacter helvolus]|uniref:ATPase, T2SS/T4P/T4SS family n=1 Tax=Pseudoclavibacter helvolus TaxID=255205 RepID=UPI0024AD2E7D|nr:ATPase, T2SS/T4P/T4SS family [Pseudoclavibacter helvolus]